MGGDGRVFTPWETTELSLYTDSSTLHMHNDSGGVGAKRLTSSEVLAYDIEKTPTFLSVLYSTYYSHKTSS